MANNQYVNKVIFGNDTLIDISSDTVTADTLITGYTAHDRSGASITGSLGPVSKSAAGLCPILPDENTTTKFLRQDGAWAVPPDTTYSAFVQSGSSAAAGLVPAPSSTAGTTAFLCEDGTWKIPYSVMTGATSSVAGASGLVPAPGTGDVDKFLAGDGTYKSGGLPMVILSYGNSTWDDFIAAYNNNVIVYCRASSNSNPATGAQGRMAFMAYINNATTPTEVEFQYYRSVSSHSDTQMGDEVYVYKLNKTSGWSVTKRLASLQKITATGITIGYTASTNVMTLTNDVTVSDSLSDTSTTAALSAAKGKALDEGKADKVTSATSGDVATLDSNGNLVDSGKTLGVSVPANAVFTDTTYSVMTGATSNADGASGLVPAPETTDVDKFLKGDGTWGVPSSSSSSSLPSAPSSDGEYYLKCTISSGTATYSWVSIPAASGVSF